METGQAQFGVVPIENSTQGVITHTLDLLINSTLFICGEVDLRIQHNLISNEKDLADITRVYSHQQSLAQCRRWLDEHLPGVEQYAVRSNSEAVRLIIKRGEDEEPVWEAKRVQRNPLRGKRQGYHLWTYKGANSEGLHELRLYNANGTLICRREFEVVSGGRR